MLEVAELVALGLSNKAIARRLGLAYRSVTSYVVEIDRRIPGDEPPRLKIIAWWWSRRTAA